MKRFVTIALFFSVLLIAGCMGKAIPADQLSGNPGALLFNGHANSKAKCFKCHNGDGKGTSFGKDLTVVVPHRSEKMLMTIIRNGKKSMPAFGKKLSDEEISALVTYLREAFSEDSAESPEAH